MYLWGNELPKVKASEAIKDVVTLIAAIVLIALISLMAVGAGN